MERQKVRNSQDSLEKDQTVVLTILDFKICCEAIIVNTVVLAQEYVNKPVVQKSLEIVL
jgi:hypothetical protein